MTRSVVKMPTVLGIGAGQTASVDLPTGLTYDSLYLRCNAQIAAAAKDLAAADWATVFGDVRLIVNGDVKITMAAADLVMRAQYYGEVLTAGVLALHLASPWMQTAHDQDVTGYGTAPINGIATVATFTMEMDIKAGQTVNALTVYADQSAALPWGPHLEIKRFNKQVGVIGTTQITDLPRGNWGLMAMHFASSAQTRAQVFRNQTKILDLDPAMAAAVYDEGGRVPQANFTHVDFCKENRILEALPMNAQSFNLELDMTATGNFNLYTETIMPAN